MNKLSYTENNEPVEIEDVEAIAETADGLLIWVDMDEIWLPKRFIHDLSEVYAKGHTGRLVIPKWLAIKKELAE